MHDGEYLHASVNVKGGRICDVWETPVTEFPQTHCCSTAGRDPSTLPPPIETMGTNTLAFNGIGVAADPLDASAFVSSAAGNVVTLKADGLFATLPVIDRPALEKTDTQSIRLAGAGTVQAPLVAHIQIAPTEDNILNILANGIMIAASDAAWYKLDPDQVNITTQNANHELLSKIQWQSAGGLQWGGNGTEANPLTLKELLSTQSLQALSVKAVGSSYPLYGFYVEKKYCGMMSPPPQSVDFYGAGVLDDFYKVQMVTCAIKCPSLDTPTVTLPLPVVSAISAYTTTDYGYTTWCWDENGSYPCQYVNHNHAYYRQFTVNWNTFRPFAALSLGNVVSTELDQYYVIGCKNQHIAVSRSEAVADGNIVVHGYAFSVPAPNKDPNAGEITFELGEWNGMGFGRVL